MEKRDRVIVGIVIAVALIIIPAALFFGGSPAPVSILTPHIQKHIKTHIQGWAKPHTTELVKELQAEFHAEIKESVSSVTQKLEAELNEDMLLLRREVKELKEKMAKCKCAA